MPIPEALALISASATLARTIFALTAGVYSWMDGVKHIDETVKNLYVEVSSFRETIQTVEKSLSSDIVRQVACVEDDDASIELWTSMCDALKECRSTSIRLRDVLEALARTKENDLLRKIKLDMKDSEIQGLRDQIAVHNKRLTLAMQMVQLRVSCATPELITTNLTGQITALRSLMSSQMEMIAELVRNPSTSQGVTTDIVHAYASTIGRGAQSLMASTHTIYKGSDWSGSIRGDDAEITAVEHWLNDTASSEADVQSLPSALWLSTRRPETNITDATVGENIIDATMEKDIWRTLPLPSDPEEAMEQQRIERYLQLKLNINVHTFGFAPDVAISSIFASHIKQRVVPTNDACSSILFLARVVDDPRFERLCIHGNLIPDFPNRYSTSIPLLHAACYLGWEGLVDILLHHGASPDVPVQIALDKVNKMARTEWEYDLVIGHVGAALIAGVQGHTRILQRLLDSGATLNIGHPQVDREVSALHVVALIGHVQAVQIILDAGVDLNRPLMGPTTVNQQRNRWVLHTALHCACSAGQARVVRFLIDRGADLEIKNVKGHTPLDITGLKGAVAVGKQDLTRAQVYADIITMLVDAGAVSNKAVNTYIRSINKFIGRAAIPEADNGRTSLFRRIVQQSSA